MARRVFVLINTVPDKSEKVQMALKAFEEFASVERVTAPYDIIAVMETEDMARMGLVVSKVAGMPGVERWLVCAGYTDGGHRQILQQ